MRVLARPILTAVLLTVLATAIGLWIGYQLGSNRAGQEAGLDDILHHQLGLSAEQEQRLASIETRFAQSRKMQELEMRAANHDLAAALGTDHALGSAAKQAIARFHTAMGTLQEQTIVHVLEMRSVLTPQQAERFDKTVQEALVSDHL